MATKVTEEMLHLMKIDLMDGMTKKDIAKKYGLSYGVVKDRLKYADVKKNPSLKHPLRPSYCFRGKKDTTPITREEILTMKRRVHVGSILHIPVKRYNLEGMVIGKTIETCTVEIASSNLVVARRSNGTKLSITYLELCMLARGMEP